jgi:hypothetical protein
LSRPVKRLDRPFWDERTTVLHNENGGDIQKVAMDRVRSLRNVILDVDSDIDELVESTRRNVGKALTTIPVKKMQPLSILNRAQENEPLTEIGDMVVQRANGVMLWVVLVFDSLAELVEKEGFISLPDLRKKLDHMLSGLEDFYSQFVSDLEARLGEKGTAKARRTLMWINTANEIKAFTLGELWDALAIPEEPPSSFAKSNEDPIIADRIPIRSWGDFRRMLNRTCGPFVDVIQPTTGSAHLQAETSSAFIIQLMHQTAKDFLRKTKLAGRLSFQPNEASLMIHHASIQYIRLVLPEQPCQYGPIPVLHLHSWRDF